VGRQRKNSNLTVNKNKNNMKKTIAIVALAATLASCGGSKTETPTTDSTKVTVDSVTVDSTKTVDTVKAVK
jgi:ABC-type glycerol-3-phosphate transport system substrate-binding protein